MLLPEVVLVKSIAWHHLGKNRGFKSGSSCRETQLPSIITQLETICMNKLGLGDADEAENVHAALVRSTQRQSTLRSQTARDDVRGRGKRWYR